MLEDFRVLAKGLERGFGLIPVSMGLTGPFRSLGFSGLIYSLLCIQKFCWTHLFTMCAA